MKIAITGGAGFIGSNIARACIKAGHKVTIIDNLASGKLSNLHDIKKKITFYKKSIISLPALKNAFKGKDIVFHLAAIPSVQRSVENPLASNKVNIEGLLNVLIAARDCKVKRVIYSASSSAYGDNPKLPKKEDFEADPLSPYAAQKYIGEVYCKQFSSLYGLDTVSLRYFNVFGPYQDPKSDYAAVIPLFIKYIQAGKRPTIFGNGKQSRDFTYIDNVVKANLLAMKAKKKLAGQVINIACGARISLLQLVQRINRIVGKKIKPKFAPPRMGDVMHSLADIKKAKRLIGFSPIINFDDGLKRTMDWYGK